MLILNYFITLNYYIGIMNKCLRIKKLFLSSCLILIKYCMVKILF